MFRKAFTGPELLKRVQKVEKMFPHVTVGTADSWNKFADGAADALITGGVKYLYAYLSILEMPFTKGGQANFFVSASSMPLLSGKTNTSLMLPQLTLMI